jgi:hypothetical protein
MLSSSDALSTPNIKSETPGVTATKCCTKCGESLPLSQFRWRKDQQKHKTSCIPCNNQQVFEHNKANPFKKSLSEAKRRAKIKGLEFDLTEEFLISIDRDVCPYLHIPITFGYGTGKARGDNSKSLDRIDSARGYTKDNVIYCSWRANNLLSDGSLPELTLLVHNFRRILTSTKPTNEN